MTTTLSAPIFPHHITTDMSNVLNSMGQGKIRVLQPQMYDNRIGCCKVAWYNIIIIKSIHHRTLWLFSYSINKCHIRIILVVSWQFFHTTQKQYSHSTNSNKHIIVVKLIRIKNRVFCVLQFSALHFFYRATTVCVCWKYRCETHGWYCGNHCKMLFQCFKTWSHYVVSIN